MPQWKQYSGIWTPTQQAQAIAAGTWTGLPQYELYVWGYNSVGELGLNNTVNYSSPVQIDAGVNWTTAWRNSKEGYSLTVKSDGTMWATGTNANGQLGIDTTVVTSSPTQVGALTTWLKVAAEYRGSIALKTDGTMWAWGSPSSYGGIPLNLPDSSNRSSPIQVGSDTNWAYITQGVNFGFAVKTDGTLWAWGSNDYGQLGLNIASTINKSSPTQVGALTNWSAIEATSDASGFCVAIKTDGTLWAWGRNNGGQLGLGPTYITRSSPVQVGALTTWEKPVRPTRASSGAVKTNGTLWVWGFNENGKLGQNNDLSYNSPVQVGSDAWSDVSTADNVYYGVKTNGTLWSWGNDAGGKLGQNTENVHASSPTQIGIDTNWYVVGRGYNAVSAVKLTKSTT
jgi:alpha-tubulin suppressor-like RCC1 family protein